MLRTSRPSKTWLVATAAAPRVVVPSEDEMNIEFDEEESPQQSAQPKPVSNASPKPLPVQVGTPSCTMLHHVLV